MPFLSIIESADSNILKSAFLDLEGPSVAGKFVDTYRTKNDPYFTGQDDKPEEQEKIKNGELTEGQKDKYIRASCGLEDLFKLLKKSAQ